MRNNKNFKNTITAIALILLMIITISGATYAFFNYSRSGSSNNTLRSGKITFSFTDGNSNISLTNAFPIAGTTGVALSSGSSSTSFTITGNTSVGNSITYAIWAIPGDTSSQAVLGSNYANYTSKFRDSEIYTHITKDSGGADFTGLTNSTSGTAIDDLLDDFEGLPVPTNGKLLGYGTITGTGSNVTATFTVRMWIDDSKVNICASGCTYTEGEYSHKYYTMKISVTATDGVYEISQDPIPSCPGCVFAAIGSNNPWYTTWSSNTPSVITLNSNDNNNTKILKLAVQQPTYHVTTDYTELALDGFLGMILNGSGQIERAFLCGIRSDVPFCIEGTSDGSKHADNLLLLNSSDLYNGSCTGDASSRVDCSSSPMVSSFPDGSVYIHVLQDSTISNSGELHCKGHYYK